MTGIPHTFPVVAFDKGLLAFRVLGDMVIHAELEFAHKIEVPRLESAFELILDAEPVLGCRWAPGTGMFGRARWERLQGARRNFSVVETAAAYESFLVQPPFAEQGPQLRGALLPGTGGAPDRLAITITHEAADAGGLKETVARLGEIYTRLAREPAYRPEPNVRGSRGIWQVLRHVGVRHFPRIYWNYLVMQRRTMSAKAGPHLGWSGAREGRPVCIVRHLPAERVNHLAAWGRQHGATLNDLLVNATMRALAGLAKNTPPSPFQLLTTADLRRHYLPTEKAEGICNLSGLEPLRLDVPGDSKWAESSFEETLALVVRTTRARKANWIGLSDAVGAAISVRLLPDGWLSSLFSAAVRSLNQRSVGLNALTNMGPISREATTFDRPATRAWLRVPPMYPPRLVLGLSGYDGSLTLSGATFAPGGARTDLERVFDRIHDELPGEQRTAGAVQTPRKTG